MIILWSGSGSLAENNNNNNNQFLETHNTIKLVSMRVKKVN